MDGWLDGWMNESSALIHRYPSSMYVPQQRLSIGVGVYMYVLTHACVEGAGGQG